MLPNTVAASTLTGSPIPLTKRSEQNGETKYVGSYSSANGNRNVRMSVQHTRPDNPTSRVSSFIKIYVDYYDEAGNFEHTSESHRVFKVSGGREQFLVSPNAIIDSVLEVTDFSDEFFLGAY